MRRCCADLLVLKERCHCAATAYRPQIVQEAPARPPRCRVLSPHVDKSAIAFVFRCSERRRCLRCRPPAPCFFLSVNEMCSARRLMSMLLRTRHTRLMSAMSRHAMPPRLRHSATVVERDETMPLTSVGYCPPARAPPPPRAITHDRPRAIHACPPYRSP